MNVKTDEYSTTEYHFRFSSQPLWGHERITRATVTMRTRGGVRRGQCEMWSIRTNNKGGIDLRRTEGRAARLGELADIFGGMALIAAGYGSDGEILLEAGKRDALRSFGINAPDRTMNEIREAFAEEFNTND